MCGIAGLMLSRPMAADALEARVTAINTALAHRGPDGEGVWTEPEAGVALAQRRLAIVDLSPTGAQPMLSASGRLAMTYNGEIYNYRELRAELEALGVRFRGKSDSEVLIEAWDRWGEEATLARLNGMFAIAMYDRRERTLTLARDRFGIKPLLWVQTGEGLFFASELKALLHDPACPRDIDPGAVGAFLRHGAVPAPWTIIAGIRKLEPGTVMRFTGDSRAPSLHRYWSPLTAVKERAGRSPSITFEEAVAEGEALLSDAVERQMIADVPLGAFLSGGIDSSLVVALMQRSTGGKVDTFTIGFAEKAWDESPQAAAVAAHLGTRHHTLMTSGREALDLAAAMGETYDEPFADSSQIPTTLLCRLVRQHVTVALSGDGGDETFAGYQRYDWGLRLAGLHTRVPTALRSAAGLAGGLPVGMLAWAAGLVRKGGPHAGHKAQRAARILAAPDFISGYRQLLSLTADPARLMNAPAENVAEAYGTAASTTGSQPIEIMQLTDALSYLPDDILTKTDRASMSVGLEVRVPLLDHRIWEWSLALPTGMNRADGRGKALLRAILGRHVPLALTDRPKTGFAVPLADWLRTDLRPLAEDLLPRAGAALDGPLKTSAVHDLWRAHLAGRHDHGPVLWAAMMLESWRRSLPAAGGHG
jgi:asparagine synthase (glutamine-hydrolysing)